MGEGEGEHPREHMVGVLLVWHMVGKVHGGRPHDVISVHGNCVPRVVYMHRMHVHGRAKSIRSV